MTERDKFYQERARVQKKAHHQFAKLHKKLKEEENIEDVNKYYDDFCKVNQKEIRIEIEKKIMREDKAIKNKLRQVFSTNEVLIHRDFKSTERVLTQFIFHSLYPVINRESIRQHEQIEKWRGKWGAKKSQDLAGKMGVSATIIKQAKECELYANQLMRQLNNELQKMLENNTIL